MISQIKIKTDRTVQPIRKVKDREAIARYLRSKSLRDFALFEFGIRVGRRISDLVSLNIKDVARLDRKGRLIIKERLQICEKKTGKFTNILINDRARRVLSEYITPRFRAAVSLDEFLDEPLFYSRQKSRNGEYRLGRIQAYRILSGAARECGCDFKVGTHTLRKTFGYCLYNNGVNITLIQKALNHTHPEITLAYIGITQNDIDKALETL